MQWTKYIFATLLWLLLSTPSLGNETVRVQVGDLVQVNLPGEATLNKGFQVDKRGRITLPEVGTLTLQAIPSNNSNKLYWKDWKRSIEISLLLLSLSLNNKSLFQCKDT